MLRYCPTRPKRLFIALSTLFTILFAGSPNAIADPTVIGVDGTTIAKNLPFLEGALALNHGMLLGLEGFRRVIVDYPQSFGILTLSSTGYDKSVAIGKAGTITAIKQAQNGDPSVPVKVACLSQGSDVCTQANDQLHAEGYNQSNVEYFLEGNVDNAYLGMKVWIPRIGQHGVFVPGPGVTLGAATPTSGSDARINQVSYEYDGFARTPEYPINLLADLNAVVGTLLEHGSYSKANPYAANNIVSTTPDGRITNIVIPVNEVPLLTVAKFLGLPQRVVDVVNPTLKAIIDTAYSPIPVGPGAYPTEAVTMKLFPSKEKFQTDIKNVQKGLAESRAQLAAILKPATSPRLITSPQEAPVAVPQRVAPTRSRQRPTPATNSRQTRPVTSVGSTGPSTSRSIAKANGGHRGKADTRPTRGGLSNKS